MDNASSDNSVVEIKRRYESSVKLVASDYNLGFGRANNWGTKHASGQYLFLLNSDTVLRNDPFPYFLEFLHARENLGALGTYLKDGNGIYTKSGGNFYSMRKYLMMGVKRLFLVPSNEEIPLSNTSRKVDYVIGADLFIRKELFEQIGMFSKHIFMYFEDVELCKRLYDAGYHSYLIPGPEIIHFVKSSSTSQFSRVYNTASLMYCIQKEHSYVGFFFFHYHPVGNDADHDLQKRACRRCKPHREQRCRVHFRHQVCARNAHKRNARNVVDKRDHRLAAGAEIAAEAEVDACKQAVEDISVHVLSAGGDNALIRCKQADHRLGDKLEQDADYDAEADGNADCVPHSLLCPAVVPGADVLRADGGHRREHRRGHKEQKAYDLFDYADGGGIRKPAAVCNDRYDNEGDLNNPVLKRTRHADGQYLTHDAALRLQVAF